MINESRNFLCSMYANISAHSAEEIKKFNIFHIVFFLICGAISLIGFIFSFCRYLRHNFAWCARLIKYSGHLKTFRVSLQWIITTCDGQTIFKILRINTENKIVNICNVHKKNKLDGTANLQFTAQIQYL